jgi:hypothetical protein
MPQSKLRNVFLLVLTVLAVLSHVESDTQAEDAKVLFADTFDRQELGDTWNVSGERGRKRKKTGVSRLGLWSRLLDLYRLVKSPASGAQESAGCGGDLDG